MGETKTTWEKFCIALRTAETLILVVSRFNGVCGRRIPPGSCILGCAAGHFLEAIIREILSLPFFDGSQNKAGDEFRLVTIGVTGCRPAAGWIPHPFLAEVCGSDERVDFTDDDAVLFQLGACCEAESKQRTLLPVIRVGGMFQAIAGPVSPMNSFG